MKRQQDFADYWLECGNASEAAVRAGYSKKYAAQNADKLLKNTKIKEYIEMRLKELEDRKIATIEEVLQFYTSVMRGEVKDQFDLDPPLSERTRAANELAKRFNEKRRLEIEIARLEAANRNLHVEVAPAQDNFIEALNAIAADVWSQEEDGEKGE